MINFDLVEPATLTGFVREVPYPANYTLNQWLVDETIPDIEAEFDNIIKTNQAAKFRAFDAETPVGSRPSLERKRVALPPLGQKTPIAEEERLKLERARSGGDTTGAMVDAAYNDAEINTLAVLARQELARGDVLTDGRFTLRGENGLTLEADFGVMPSHLPVAMTSWLNHADADPFEEMRGWADIFTDDAGEPPAWALTSRTVIGHMLRNEKVRKLASGNGITPSMISRAQLNTLLESFELPQLVSYNTLVDVDGVSTRPIPADRMVYLPQDPRTLGRTVWGITAEALELAGGTNPQLAFEELPGLIGVVMKIGDPVRTWTKVGGTGMPIIGEPRRLLTARVL
ncbi:MAG TPA: major capsid protein [Catenuloplanes sp.]|jgi:hypothetical protein